MNKIEYIGIKEDGKPYRIVNEATYYQELDKLPKGRYRHTVERWRKHKSESQLGYYFACVIPMSMRLLNESGWEITTSDQCDMFWKDLYAKKEVVNRHTGEIRMIPALKRDFNTMDMMTFVDAIRQHCSEYLGGYIPEPETQITMEL